MYSCIDVNRFWDNVIKGNSGQCWTWTGSINKTGKGQISYWDNGVQSTVYASRYAYWLFYEDIPVGYNVYRNCGNSLCVNPDHLWLGTYSDFSRMAAKKRKTTKLTVDKVLKIRKLFEDNKDTKVLAEQFGVARSTIYDVVHRRNWRDV